LKDPSTDDFVGDLDAEVLLDAGHDEKNVEGIEVHLAADKRHLIRDVRVGPQLQVAPQDRLHLVEQSGVNRTVHRRPHYNYVPSENLDNPARAAIIRPTPPLTRSRGAATAGQASATMAV
jgi:hypothetical protein